MTDSAPASTTRHEAGLLCPSCRVDLVMTDRQGVEIDYCPKCRGVWLDRGELDKIIERSAALEAGPEAPITPEPRRGSPGYGQPWDSGYSQNQGSDHGGGHRRRRGFLGDLFD